MRPQETWRAIALTHPLAVTLAVTLTEVERLWLLLSQATRDGQAGSSCYSSSCRSSHRQRETGRQAVAVTHPLAVTLTGRERDRQAGRQ
jgi:hypothetical protein